MGNNNSTYFKWNPFISGKYYSVKFILLSFIFSLSNKSNSQTILSKQVFDYTGSDQVLTIPQCVNKIKVKIWGAGGGGSFYNSENAGGGAGGYVEGLLAVTPGDVFSVIVGEGGACDGTFDNVSYGFGGSYSSLNIGGFGGGLSGIFTGTGTITQADQARALLIAGGGGASERGAPDNECSSGGQGGDGTFGGGMPDMQGENGGTAVGGGGGGGYNGGRMTLRLSGNGALYAGEGGTNFIDISITNGVSLSSSDFGNWNAFPQMYKEPPNITDADYTAWTNSANPGIGTGSMYTYSKAGYGRVVVEFYADPSLFSSVSITPTDTIICSGTSVTFTAMPGNSGTTSSYQWQLNGINIAGATGLTFTSDILNNGDVIGVIQTSACSTSSAVTNNILVHSKPISDFNNTSVCNRFSTQFTDISTTASGIINSWNWNFGDASALNNSQNPSHLYSNPGYDTVTLIVNNNFGCADTIKKTVQIYYNAIAGFRHNNVCFGDSLHFTDTSAVNSSTSITSYLWGFGDGSPASSMQNSAHLYLSAGTYNVRLLVTTADGCLDTATIPVKTFAAPGSAFTVNNTCLSDSVKFINTSVSPSMGSISGWLWDFGDATSVNTTVWNPNHLYLSSGVYHVTLITYSSNLGCADTLKDSVKVFPMPIAGFGFTNVCLNVPMNFADLSIVSGGTIVSRSWNFGDGTALNTNQNPAHLYTSAGTYTGSLVVITNSGCKDTVTKNVIVHSLPVAGFNAINVCLGATTQFSDLSTVAVIDTIQSWIWNFGDGSPVNTNENVSHQYAAAGSYNVRLINISTFGCSDTITKTNIVNPNPVVNFTASDTVGCEPLCISFQNTSSIVSGTYTHLLWDFGDGSQVSNLQDVFHCYTNDSVFSPVFYTPVLTVTSDSGCITLQSKINYITVYPKPTAGFTAQPPTTTITNPVISITNESTEANLWNWNFGDQDTASISNPVSHRYADTGTYVITLITSTHYNCADTAYQTVSIEPDFMLYIPNAFTPDNDGINDTFTGKGVFIKEFEMSIFDRWGNLIYETDDINKPWDGTANHGSETVQRDVYIYVIKATDFRNGKHNYRGMVTVVR